MIELRALVAATSMLCVGVGSAFGQDMPTEAYPTDAASHDIGGRPAQLSSSEEIKTDGSTAEIEGGLFGGLLGLGADATALFFGSPTVESSIVSGDGGTSDGIAASGNQGGGSGGIDILGDGFDPDTGLVSFMHTDVSLPGNSGLEVAIHRSRSQGRSALRSSHSTFGDWTLEVPRIERQARSSASWGDRCSDYDEDAAEGDLVWEGLRLIVPGRVNEVVIDGRRGTYMKGGATKSTVSNWMIQCKGGTGFYAWAPNGDRYTFDNYHYIQPWAVYSPSGNTDLKVYNNQLRATEVRDVSGAWVRYRYHGGATGELYRIEASDGRRIDLSNDGSKKLVTANGRTWTYHFQGRTLSHVDLPDGRKWEFDLSGLGLQVYSQARSGRTACRRTPETGTFSVTHPDGVKGTFTVARTIHGRTNVPGTRSKGSVTPDACRRAREGSHDENERVFARWTEYYSLSKKVLSGPGVPQAVWDYEYSQEKGKYSDSTSVSPLKWVRVSGPYGYNTTTYVNRRWGDWEGLVERQIVKQGTTTLQETKTSYEIGSRVGSDITRMPGGNGERSDRPRHVRRIEVKRDGETYKTEFEYHTNQSSDNFSYGFPVETKRWSTLGGGTRETEVLYFHLKGKWRLGLPRIVTNNGKPFDRYDYDSTGRMTSHKRFGVTVATYGYHGTTGHKGALSWQKDALGRTTRFWGRKRGVPTTVVRPDGVQIKRGVDNNGWVTSETDARGNTTTYQFDNGGRIKRVKPPSPFAETTYSYYNLGSRTGHLVAAMRRGNERIDTHYTGLGRPALVWRAAIDNSLSAVYQRTYYDLYGRPSRRIWPTENDARHGVDISYDALGRVTRERETVSPNATTSYAYLSDNRVRVTDPTGDVTTTYSSGYGSPEDGQPIKIRQPHGTSTDMSYDIYGNLLTVRQFGSHNGVSRNLTQRYSYDSRYRVCRHYIPEQGSSLFEYNNADEMTGVARGQSGTSGCATLPSSSKVVHSYNALGNIDFINFPDGSPDIDYRYDANENLYELYRGSSRWSYRYHANTDLPIEETLRIDGKTFQTLYAYNSNGHLARQTLKSSGQTRSIDFAPDAWGRATQARQGSKSYSSGIQYHPNGAVRKLTYGNGQVYTQEMNNRWLPSRRDIRKGSTRANEWTYTYNADGRIDFIDDKIVGSNDRDHTYDGLGRLTRARIGSTNYDYKYDVTGNLLEKRIGSRVVSMEYHTNNRLRRVRDGSSSWRSYSYDSRGNVTNDGRRGFTYDRSEQPTRLTGGATGTYVYDGNYKRVKAVHAGTLSSGSTSTPSPSPTPPPNPCLANPFAPGCFEPPTCGNVFCDRSDEGTLSALAGSVIEDLGRSSGSGSETVYSAYGSGGQLLHQRKEGTGGTVETDYIVVAGMTVARIERFRSADTITHPHTDHLGTTVSETNSAGTVLWRERATPFGERIGGQAAANNNQPSFTGHVEDARSQLTYMQGRFYDPVVGRMLAPDSVSFVGGGPRLFNRYSYTANDPINMIDPDGEFLGNIFQAAVNFFGSFLFNSVAEQSGNGGGATAAAVTIGGPTAPTGVSWQTQLHQNNVANIAATIYGPVTGSDGYLSYNEAAYHYMRGNGSDVWVEASSVNFGRTISRSEFSPVQYSPFEVAYITPRLGTESFIVHGTVGLRLLPSGTQAFIVREQYNFELHEVNGLRDVVRNIGTIGGHASHQYSGTPFYINYLGYISVGP